MAPPVRALSNFVVARDGSARALLPVGDLVFPAELEALFALKDAVRADFTETHWVPFSDVTEEAPGRPLELFALRGFLAERWPAFEAAMNRSVVSATAVAYWRLRLERLTALGAPEVIVDDIKAELAIATRGEVPAVDLASILYDVVGAASIVDVASRQEMGMPLNVDIDIATLVLLAALCCLSPEAASVDVGEAGGVAWTSLLPEHREEPNASDAILVRPAVYAESVAALEMADARGAGFDALAPKGALLRVVVEDGDV